jgi:hypothetical protein
MILQRRMATPRTEGAQKGRWGESHLWLLEGSYTMLGPVAAVPNY